MRTFKHHVYYYLVGSLFSFLFFCSFHFNLYGRGNLFIETKEIISNVLSPDSTFVDTIEFTAAFSEGDTIDMYVIGADTIYTIYATPLLDTSALSFRYEASPMKIILSNQTFPVEQGLLGINVTDMFEPGHANEYVDLPKYTSGENPWDYLSELCPTTLRVFSGQGSRFMELLGSARTAPNDPFNTSGTMMNGGYGFCIERIIPFFDNTDNDIDAPPLFDDTPGAIPFSISDDMNDDGQLNTLTSWYLSDRYKNSFEDFYHKWEEQPIYDPTDPAFDEYSEQPLYINQLIHLVNKIESENPGQSVSVMLCLNILSESATNCKNIATYLKDDNGIDLAGIEIGNEVYFGWAEDLLGFRDNGFVPKFIHYWDYINGFNYDDFSIGVDPDDGDPGDPTGDGMYFSDFDLSLVLPSDVLLDHDYLGVLKGDPSTANIPLGLPAHNLPNCGEYVFITDESDTSNTLNMGGADPCADCTYPLWNDQLAAKYSAQIPMTSTYKFDAVILHPYYTPTNVPTDAIELCNTNWLSIPLCLDGVTYGTPWTYASYDTRLKCAFDGIMGFPVIDTDADGIWDTPAVGNFRSFVTSGLKEAMDFHKAHLKFSTTDVGPEMKDIWYTEYNINSDERVTDAQVEYVGSILNTFAHAEGLWNWVLWNVKSNAGISYRPNYLSSTTLQSFLSGTQIALMNTASQDEQAIMGLDEISAIAPCDGGTVDCSSDGDCLDNSYYLRRLTYYAMQLLNKISMDDLVYLRSTALAYVGTRVNYNIPPTVFYNGNPSDPKLIVFYTNVKDVDQTFGFNPGLVYQLFPGAVSVNLYGGTINFMNANVPYTTSGKCSLYNFNNWYDCQAGGSGNMYSIETDENDILNGLASTDCPVGVSGAACVVVPKYSLGYFTINIDVNYRLGENKDVFAIYPNPTSSNFYIQQINSEEMVATLLDVEVYNSYGANVLSTQVVEGQRIDISNLPVGSYNVLIKSNNVLRDSEVLVKMK